MNALDIAAGIAQLGERQTEDLKAACSIHAHRVIVFLSNFFHFGALGFNFHHHQAFEPLSFFNFIVFDYFK